MVDGSEIKIEDWKERIVSIFDIWKNHRREDDELEIDNYGYKIFAGYLSSVFLDEIFAMSLKAFDIDREVQVVLILMRDYSSVMGLRDSFLLKIKKNN